MIDYKSLTVDFLEGKVTPLEYELMIESDHDLYQWIQEMVPEGKQYSYAAPPSFELKYYPYDIREVMKIHEQLAFGGPKGSLGYHFHVHDEISQLFSNAFPELPVALDPRPAMLRKLGITACPRYIGGSEVASNNILAKLLSDIPLDWSPKKQAEVARKRIKEAFFVEGNKYPRWIQEPEWPVHEGQPMKYIRTLRINPEFVQHEFMDVRTGFIRTVDDFY